MEPSNTHDGRLPVSRQRLRSWQTCFANSGSTCISARTYASQGVRNTGYNLLRAPDRRVYVVRSHIVSSVCSGHRHVNVLRWNITESAVCLLRDQTSQGVRCVSIYAWLATITACFSFDVCLFSAHTSQGDCDLPCASASACGEGHTSQGARFVLFASACTRSTVCFKHRRVITAIAGGAICCGHRIGVCLLCDHTSQGVYGLFWHRRVNPVRS